MNLPGLLLIGVGILAIVIGVLQARGPLARIRSLDATAANLERYETWRGRNTSVQADGPTGADEMRALLRRRVVAWGALVAVGCALIVVGLLWR